MITRPFFVFCWYLRIQLELLLCRRCAQFGKQPSGQQPPSGQQQLLHSRYSSASDVLAIVQQHESRASRQKRAAKNASTPNKCSKLRCDDVLSNLETWFAICQYFGLNFSSPKIMPPEAPTKNKVIINPQVALEPSPRFLRRRWLASAAAV